VKDRGKEERREGGKEGRREGGKEERRKGEKEGRKETPLLIVLKTQNKIEKVLE
jgi:hypothetical protein